MSDVTRHTRPDLVHPKPFTGVSVPHPAGRGDPFATRPQRPVLIGPPRTPLNLVERSTALRRLDRMAPVTVLEALPGFGKTTLVEQWTRSKRASGVPVAWIRLTRELDDGPAFLAVLHESLMLADAVRQGVPNQRAEFGQSSRAELSPAWISELVLSPTPVIAVIDDAHLASEPVIDALLDVVRASPLHVVVCCDSAHVVHEVASRHGLETNVLRGADLSVPVSELPAYAAAWGHELDASSADRLHELVGGWLLPLRLVLDATPSGSAVHITRVAHEFLLDHVLPRLPGDAELTLAMRFSVPEQVDEDLAATALDAGVAPSEEALARSLEQQGLLWRVPRPFGEAAWRYPTLLRRALLELFERVDPDGAANVHRDVARALWRRREGDVHALLRHARSARDWALLDQLWSEQGWSLAGGDPETFRFAYGDLPGAAIAEFGSLELAASLGDALAVTSQDSGWMQQVEVLLRRYMQTGSDYLRRAPRSATHHQRADMLTAAMIARRTEGRLGAARQLADAAGREYAVARSAEPTGTRTSQLAWFELQNAITQLSSGRYATALERAGTAYQLSPSTLIGSGASGLAAAMHALSGQTADARHWLDLHDALDLSDHWAAGLAQFPARVARAMLAYDRLDTAAGDAELDAVQLGAEVSGLWPLVLAVHTRHALVSGDPVAMLARLDHVRRILARHLRDPDSVGRQVFERCTVDLTLALGEVNRVQTRLGGSHEISPWLVVPAARFHLMTGDARAAVRISSAGTWRRDLHVRDRLQLLVIKALAHRELGHHQEGVSSLRRAHSLATDTGNLEPYLLLPGEDRVALLAEAGVRLEPAEESLVTQGRQLFPPTAELVQLSPRELEVLRQMRHRDSVAGLARSLSVSVNTVKKQLVSLYAKLDVHDRSSALLRAQRLGFLEEPDADPNG